MTRVLDDSKSWGLEKLWLKHLKSPESIFTCWLLGWNGGRTGSEGVICQNIQHDSPRTDVLTGWFRVPRTIVFPEAKGEAARLLMTTSETIASLHCALLVKPVSEPTQVQRKKAYTLPLERRRVK